MARPRVTPLPGPLAVFIGGMLGGGVRLAIDALIPAVGPGIPVDIIVINVAGSFTMGMLAAWVQLHGSRWWTPLLGTGALGSFTTFSALTALPWATPASAPLAIAVVVGTLAGAVAAAALGWRLVDRAPRLGPVSAAGDR